MRLIPAAASLLALTLASPLAAQPAGTPMITYPATATGPVVEEQFGEKIADPYRWLEDDVRTSKPVADWVAAENKLTQAQLATLPAKAPLAASMKAMFDYERTGVPEKRGDRYFYSQNSGLQNQSVLMVREGPTGKARLLIDPNLWAKDGATALDSWKPSDDGSKLLYAMQDGGSDWRTLKVIDVASGAVAADEIKWAKFTDLAWIGDTGFIYSRFPEPKGAEFQSLNADHTVYYHKLGTPQSADAVVYKTPQRPDLNHSATVTSDGRWIIVTSSSGTDEKYEIHAIRADDPAYKARAVITGFENDWTLIDGIGDRLWFITNKGAPFGKVTTADLSSATPQFADVVAERKAKLDGAALVGDAIVLDYLEDAKSAVELVTRDGKPLGKVALDGIGAAGGFTGKPGDPETFYSFTGFTQPTAIWRLDTATRAATPFATPKLVFDPADYVTEQRFYASKDGIKVPLFIVRRKDVTGPAPTLLYAYGGFNISVTPAFSATRMAWLQAGGVYAQANIRGGGEYGAAWHDAGRLANKQNVFDDFIAAGEYLKAQGITSPLGLAVEGRSNGGLLIGAVVNQRPDLFDAAHAAVGVMDMLRFDRFTAGRYWVDDYGYPDKQADFAVLRKYSPYHNIHAADYPAVMVSTADTDDRVVPGHSFKYIARLQATAAGDKPHLIRIETRAGHGSGKPTDKVIEEYSDIYAFLANWTGLKIAPPVK